MIISIKNISLLKDELYIVFDIHTDDSIIKKLKNTIYNKEKVLDYATI